MLRIYLTGALCIEHGQTLVGERQLPGRQGRLLLAHLARLRHVPVPRQELAELLWSDEPPETWKTSLSALVSKLRSVLSRVHSDPPPLIVGEYGCYQLILPEDAWVDVEAAVQSIEEADGAWRAGWIREAWGAAHVTATITQRPFLPGDEGPWLEAQRTFLRSLRLRALDLLTDVWLSRQEGTLAVQTAALAVAVDPLREAGYQRLMRAQAAAGHRAEALRAYQACRRVLSQELGVDPSPETEALYLELLEPGRGGMGGG